MNVFSVLFTQAKLAKTLYDDVKSADSELQKHALARLAAVSEVKILYLNCYQA